MDLEIDISALEAVNARAKQALKRFDDRMYGICKAAVDRERTTHAYQNRTHMAETHTNAVRIGQHEVRCEMAVPYASFLQRRTSKQWSRFEMLMKKCVADVGELARRTEQAAKG
jgi:hypothetical protein